MEWVTAEQDFYLKSTKISYLDPEIILEFAKVKLISHESKSWVWINPLCLFALSPIISQLKKNEDVEDFEIVTEHSVEDLQHIVNFCHSGIFPPESKGLDNVFQDFGINVSTYSNPIDIPIDDSEENFDSKEGILDSFVDTEIKEYDEEFDSPSPPPIKRRKKGKGINKYIVGQKILKTPGQKKNQFHKEFFDQIPFFAISKMAKNQFLNWEKV